MLGAASPSAGEERVVVRVQRPDGSLRIGETRAHEVLLAGSRQLVSTIEDVTERRRLEAEREAVTAAYSVLGKLAADILDGSPATEAVAAILPELRASGDFTTALVWDAAARRALALDGVPARSGFDAELARTRTVAHGSVLRLGAGGRGEAGTGGWAASLAGDEHWVVVLGSSSPANDPRSVFADVLAGLAMIVAAGARSP
jgi:hypothetical protein